jgi:hypothetical protein
MKLRTVGEGISDGEVKTDAERARKRGRKRTGTKERRRKKKGKRASNVLEDKDGNGDRRCIENYHRLVLLRPWRGERQRIKLRGRKEENAQPALLGNPRSAQLYGRTVDVKRVSEVRELSSGD